MQRLVPTITGYLDYYIQCPESDSYQLEELTSKEIPEGKIYVEDPISIHWHRHVEQHGPKPEAYAVYNIAVCV